MAPLRVDSNWSEVDTPISSLARARAFFWALDCGFCSKEMLLTLESFYKLGIYTGGNQ